MILDWLAACAIRYPYLGRAIFALRPTERAGISTLAVDSSWRLYWSPQGCAALLAAGGQPHEMICHELQHLLRDHDGRRGHRDHQAWNVAGDMEINDDLNFCDMPAGIVVPEVTGLTAEEYYATLPDACPSCGGGSGAGNPLPHEEPSDSQSEQEIADAIRDAVAADIRGTAPGTVPAGLRLWADARKQRLQLRVNPLIIARQALRELASGRNDYSYSRPNRRQQGDGVIWPASIRSRHQTAVVIDTSRSMQLHGEWVAGVLACVIRDCARAVTIDCDCAVHRVSRLRSWRDVRLSTGGGGTDMRVGVARAAEISRSILLLTDGETPWPTPWPRGLVAVLPTGEIRRG
jgi:predicted metal-dependent peptidase